MSLPALYMNERAWILQRCKEPSAECGLAEVISLVQPACSSGAPQHVYT